MSNKLVLMIWFLFTLTLSLLGQSTRGHEGLRQKRDTERDLRPSNQAEGLDEPEEECYGNREEALEFGRQCSRRCKKGVPCENTRKQCLCDGLCGMSCIKPDLSCPDLKPIENGYFIAKSTKFNSRVTYSCNEGYFLFGPRERLCQGDEDWSGTPAECRSERE